MESSSFWQDPIFPATIHSTTVLVCRLCLEAPPNLVPLNYNAHFIESIRQITTVEVLMDNPHYSIYMCAGCQEVLEQCIRFRNTCLQNDGIFRQRYQLEKGGVTVKTEPDEAAETFDEVKVEMVVPPVDEPANDVEDTRDDAESDEWELPSPEESKQVPKKQRRRKKNAAGGAKQDVAANVDTPNSDAIAMAQCQLCGKVMKKTGLTAHLSRHKPNRRQYVCQYCQKIFYNSMKLKNHVNGVHTHEFKFACDKCDKKYERTDSLRVHYIAEHSGEKRYQCKECGMRFARDSGRRHHFITVHQVGKPHQCEFCDKSFKRKQEHTLHVRTHTGEKPFSCDICGKTFSKSYNVVIHKKSHQNDTERAGSSVDSGSTL